MTGMLRTAFVTAIAALLTAGCNSGQSASASSTENDPSTHYAPNPVDSPTPVATKRPIVAKTTIPSGTPLHIALIDGISSDGSSRGDEFMGTLADPVTIDGRIVLDKGTRVRGRVLDVKDSGRVKGRASLSLGLVAILRGNEIIQIETKHYYAVAKSTKKRDTEVVAGGTGIGAAIGAIAGGGKGAAIGALVGGGAGTGEVLATKGAQLRYPPETRLSFSLVSSVDL